MTRRYELKDEEFALIADLLPPVGRPGGRWNDHRRTLDGVLWILHTGPNGGNSPSVTASGRASTTASTAGPATGPSTASWSGST